MALKRKRSMSSSSSTTSDSEDEDQSAPDSFSIDESVYMEKFANKMEDGPYTRYIKFTFLSPELVQKITDEYKPFFPVVYSADRVKIKLSEEEKKIQKQIYRSNYNKRDYVRKKAEADKKDQEKIKARKEYAALPEVKQRKSEMSKARRIFFKDAVQANKDEWEAFKRQNVTPLPKRRRTTKKDISQEHEDKKTEGDIQQ